jgi:hypothetical protein
MDYNPTGGVCRTQNSGFRVCRRGVCPAGSAYLDQAPPKRKGKMSDEVRFAELVEMIE